jgi:hypothetical protein
MDIAARKDGVAAAAAAAAVAMAGLQIGGIAAGVASTVHAITTTAAASTAAAVTAASPATAAVSPSHALSIASVLQGLDSLGQRLRSFVEPLPPLESLATALTGAAAAAAGNSGEASEDNEDEDEDAAEMAAAAAAAAAAAVTNGTAKPVLPRRVSLLPLYRAAERTLVREGAAAASAFKAAAAAVPDANAAPAPNYGPVALTPSTFGLFALGEALVDPICGLSKIAIDSNGLSAAEVQVLPPFLASNPNVAEFKIDIYLPPVLFAAVARAPAPVKKGKGKGKKK